MGRTLVSPKPKRNEIIEFFCTWKKISVQFKMRIAIAIFSTLIVTFCYLDISFALPTNTKTQADIRASLITKDNVAQYLEAQRQKKIVQILEIAELGLTKKMEPLLLKDRGCQTIPMKEPLIEMEDLLTTFLYPMINQSRRK